MRLVGIESHAMFEHLEVFTYACTQCGALHTDRKAAADSRNVGGRADQAPVGTMTAEGYRELAREFVQSAETADNDELRKSYLDMARLWMSASLENEQSSPLAAAGAIRDLKPER